MCFNEFGVGVFELYILHVSDVVHYLKLLHEVVLHSFFNHIPTSQEPPDSALEYVYIALDHFKYFSVQVHSEAGLDLSSS